MRVSSITGRILSYGIATAVASLVFASATMQAQAGHSGHKRTAATHRHVAKHQVHAGRHGSRKVRVAHGRHRHGASERRQPRDSAANQAEFVKTPAQYLSEQTLSELATKGRELAAKHAETLTKIEEQYGVPSSVVLAIWGRETTFGTERQPYNAIRILTALAGEGKRGAMFRNELKLARLMLKEGHITYNEMRSSSAGAMGQTQFMPSDFYRHAVDFDGDGRRDIWHSVPDALASAAKQLADKGWQRGQAWAYEVRSPASLDCTAADPELKLPVGEWLKRGYTLASDRQLDDEALAQPASLVLPAGIYGPAFLALPNFRVIKTYNFADLYALFVGKLADRIADVQSTGAAWEDIAQLGTGQLAAMQRYLTRDGFYEGKVDGMGGSRTRLALGRYQKAAGLKVDCWPTASVLNLMANNPIRRDVASAEATIH